MALLVSQPPPLTSLDAGILTGTHTLPDSVLSTNVPLLSAANTFTAQQTISASVAGPLKQLTNASTTGAGLVIGSTVVASAGAGLIAPAIAATQVIPATTRYGLVSIGSAPFDGTTSGKFVGPASGTALAINAPLGYTGDLLNMQAAGTLYCRYSVGGVGLEVRQSNNPGQLAAQLGNQGQNFFPQPLRNNVGTLTLGNTSDTGVTALAAAASSPLTCKGAASQTADLQRWQDSTAAVQFGIMNAGSGASPLWALRVRRTSGAESMAQAHTAGSATGLAIAVYDDTGASLGWINLTA